MAAQGVKGLRFVAGGLVMALAAVLARPAHAGFEGHDTLDCAVPGGGHVRMRRAYDVSLYPLPIIGGRRVKEAGRWEAVSYEREGDVPWKLKAFATSSGNSSPEWLARSCAQLGMKEGVILLPRGFATRERAFTMPVQVSGTVPLELKRAPDELRAEMDRRRLIGTNFVLVMPAQGGLVSEEPLLQRDTGGWWNSPFGAVYQSRSADDGKTWSEPVVTTEAVIFELGRTWDEQCFLGVPSGYNGKAVEWPARCQR